MKKLASFILLAGGLWSGAAGAQSQNQIANEINTMLAPNTRGAITASNLQQVLSDLNNSKASSNNPTFTGTVSGSAFAGDASATTVPTPSLSQPVGTLSWIVSWLSGMNSVASLRTSYHGLFGTVTTLGYYATGDGGGAVYRYDPADTTSADDGCSVIVSTADGSRWKKVLTPSVDLRQCGAKGDDSDDTAAVQTTFNYASANGLQVIVPTAKTFKLTATINVSVKPVRVRGFGVDPGDLAGNRGLGSWFHLAHLGVGFAFTNVGYAGDNEMIDVGTFRDQPAPTSSSFAPIAADFDVVISGSQAVIDMTMLNPTNGLKITNNVGQRVHVRRLRGQFLGTGILGDFAMDKTKIDYVDMWPYWYNNQYANAYTSQNTDTVYMKKMDGLDGGYLFSFFAKSALRYGKNTTAGNAGLGVSSEHHWNAVYADGTKFLTLFDSNAQYTNLTVDWATQLQDTTGTAGDYGITFNAAPDVSLAFGDLKMNGLRGGFAYVDGARSRMTVGTFHEGTFGRAGAVPGFVGINGAEVRISQYNRANPAQTVYGTNPIPGGPSFTPPNNGSPRTGGSVFAVLDQGTAGGTTDANGLVTFGHHADMVPNDIRIFPSPVLGSYRIVSVTSSQITIRCLDNSGNQIGAGVAVNFAYQLGMSGTSLATTYFGQ